MMKPKPTIIERLWRKFIRTMTFPLWPMRALGFESVAREEMLHKYSRCPNCHIRYSDWFVVGGKRYCYPCWDLWSYKRDHDADMSDETLMRFAEDRNNRISYR